MIQAKWTTETDKLKKLATRIQRNVLKKAVRKGAKLVQQAVKANVPVDTGALRQSVTTKVDAVRNSTVVYGVVGPKTRFKKGGNKPSRYAHLANRKHHFLEKSWNSRRSQYLQAVRDVIASEIQAMLS